MWWTWSALLWWAESLTALRDTYQSFYYRSCVNWSIIFHLFLKMFTYKKIYIYIGFPQRVAYQCIELFCLQTFSIYSIFSLSPFLLYLNLSDSHYHCFLTWLEMADWLDIKWGCDDWRRFCQLNCCDCIAGNVSLWQLHLIDWQTYALPPIISSWHDLWLWWTFSICFSSHVHVATDCRCMNSM